MQIHAEDRALLIADISTALADMKVPLLEINTPKRTEDIIIMNLTVACKNIDHCRSIVARLKAIRGVDSISRAHA